MRLKLVFISILTVAGFMANATVATAEDEPESSTLRIQKLWNYFDPAGAREKFEALRQDARTSEDQSYYLELLTQIARTWGLENQFDTAHAILDEVEAALSDSVPVARVRYLLERGRTFRSSGEVKKSAPLFTEAYELGRKHGAEFLAIDAAHMAALVADSVEDRHRWNLTGVRIAETSKDSLARGWMGSLNNNMGWDYFDAGLYAKALRHFQDALKFREEQGIPQHIRIARWCVAKTLRVMGSADKALEMQLALEKELKKAKETDGYVFEELGELYLVKQDKAKAKEFMAKAYKELAKDSWFVEHESERLERLRTVGEVDSLKTE